MKFHKFGNPKNPIIVFLHGALTPWQMWQEHIEYFSNKFFVIAVALDAHVEEGKSEYLSAKDEAEKIIDHIASAYGKKIFLLAGLSMGGVIANKIFESARLDIEFLVLDGAPLVPPTSVKFMNSIIEKIIFRNYLSIIKSSRERNRKTLDNFAKYFMPEKYLESFLMFADTMSDESIKNIVSSACSSKLVPLSATSTKILFIHGTKPNEIISMRAASILKKTYKNLTVKVLRSYSHFALAIYHPEEWCRIVSDFINCQVD